MFFDSYTLLVIQNNHNRHGRFVITHGIVCQPVNGQGQGQTLRSMCGFVRAKDGQFRLQSLSQSRSQLRCLSIRAKGLWITGRGRCVTAGALSYYLDFYFLQWLCGFCCLSEETSCKAKIIMLANHFTGLIKVHKNDEQFILCKESPEPYRTFCPGEKMSIGVIPKIMRQMCYKMAQKSYISDTFQHLARVSHRSRINSLHAIFLSCLIIFGTTHRVYFLHGFYMAIPFFIFFIICD